MPADRKVVVIYVLCLCLSGPAPTNNEQSWQERAKAATTFMTLPAESLDYESIFHRSISVGERLWSNSGGLGDTREPSRYAHRAGPDPEAERQYSPRECVVQAGGGDLGKTHLQQHGGAQFGLKDLRRLRCKIRSRGTAASMQRDG